MDNNGLFNHIASVYPKCDRDEKTCQSATAVGRALGDPPQKSDKVGAFDCMDSLGASCLVVKLSEVFARRTESPFCSRLSELSPSFARAIRETDVVLLKHLNDVPNRKSLYRYFMFVGSFLDLPTSQKWLIVDQALIKMYQGRRLIELKKMMVKRPKRERVENFDASVLCIDEETSYLEHAEFIFKMSVDTDSLGQITSGGASEFCSLRISGNFGRAIGKVSILLRHGKLLKISKEFCKWQWKYALINFLFSAIMMERLDWALADEDISFEKDRYIDRYLKEINAMFVKSCPCTVKWKTRDGHCYRVYSSYMDKKTCPCEIEGGALASIHSEGENDFVYDSMLGGASSGTTNLTRLGTLGEGGETWEEDGTPVDYANWAPGEPRGGAVAGRCVFVGGRGGKRWTTGECQSEGGVEHCLCKSNRTEGEEAETTSPTSPPTEKWGRPEPGPGEDPAWPRNPTTGGPADSSSAPKRALNRGPQSFLVASFFLVLYGCNLSSVSSRV